MKNKKILIIVIVLIVLLGLAFTLFRNSPFPDEAKCVSIELKDGEYSRRIVLTKEEKIELLKKANTYEFKITGIKFPTHEDEYEIIVDKQKIILHGKHLISSGFLEYECHKNIFELSEYLKDAK